MKSSEIFSIIKIILISFGVKKRNIVFAEQSVTTDKIAFSLKEKMCIITLCSIFKEHPFSIYIYPNYDDIYAPSFEKSNVTLGNTIDILQKILPVEKWGVDFLESSHFNFLGNEPVQRQKIAFYKDLIGLPGRFLRNLK